MKMRKLVIFLISACMLAGCSQTASASANENVKTYSNISLDSGFDTFFSLQEASASQDAFNEDFTAASELFKHYNDLFDIYNDYDGISNVKTINDNAGIQPVKVDADIIDMLKLAKSFYDLSDGEFDVTIGALLKVWHTYREDGIALNEDGKLGGVPSQEELAEAYSHRGWDKVVIDEQASTVYITDASVSLDVGGIAKGYATEKVAQMLESRNIIAGAVNAGGNNRTIHQKADGTSWRVGIQNPGSDGSLLAISKDGTCSFVTSGDYERYYQASDGNTYHHIIDPQTLFPATHFHSVSVITADSGVADCLSTTLFTLTYEEGLALIQTYEQQNPGTDIQAVWIMDPDKKVDTQYGKESGGYFVAYTEGLKDSITWADAS